MELFASDDLTIAAAYAKKCDMEVTAIHRAEKRGVREKLNFTESPFYTIPYGRTGRSVGN